MTDREKHLLDEQPVDAFLDDDFVTEDVHRGPGEEIDPDSLRPAPAVDEEGEPVAPVIDDDSEHTRLV